MLQMRLARLAKHNACSDACALTASALRITISSPTRGSGACRGLRARLHTAVLRCQAGGTGASSRPESSWASGWGERIYAHMILGSAIIFGRTFVGPVRILQRVSNGSARIKHGPSMGSAMARQGPSRAQTARGPTRATERAAKRPHDPPKAQPRAH